jgi:uncharacterized phiE125 gp8 family phage protein
MKMNMYLVKPPEKEMISLEEGKNYLRVDHDFDDDCLTSLIRSTREALETVIQKSVLRQTLKYIINGNFFLREKYVSFCGNTVIIPLPKPPIIKIVSVTLDGKKIDDEKYCFEKSDSTLILNMRMDCKKPRTLEVIYEAGIAEDCKDIPYQLKLANLMLLANAYQERYSHKNDDIFSKGVRRLLSPFLNLKLY